MNAITQISVADLRANLARFKAVGVSMQDAAENFRRASASLSKNRESPTEADRLAYILGRIDALMAGSICALIGDDEDGDALLLRVAHATHPDELEAARHRLYAWLRDRAAAVAGREFDEGRTV